MIRTTISRIKRVWAFTFAPRLLRGDQRYAPGKFKLLSNLKSTSSTDGGVDHGTSHTYKESMEPKRGLSDNCLTRDYFAVNESMEAVAKRHGAPPLYYSTSSCRCDKCNKVIAEIFGTEINNLQEPEPKDVALSNTESDKSAADASQSRVIEDSIRQTNADAIVRNTTHCIAAHAVKTEDPAVFQTDNEEVAENNSIYRDNYRTMLWYEVVLKECKDKNLDSSTKHVNETDEMYTNLYDVDPEECDCYTASTSEKLCVEYKDPSEISNWDEVYETALEENSVSSEPNDTVNVYNVVKSGGIPVDTYVDPRLRTYYPQNVDRIFEDSSFQENPYLASTTEHDDQKLTQKLEKIQELPLVPTEKPPIDGLHSPPRALSNTEGSEDTFDEVAKRCLTSPSDQIDKVLLKEMENIGIPLSMQNSACGIKMEDNMQASINNPKKETPKKDIELGNSRETVSPNAKTLNNLSGLQLHAVPQAENQIDVKKVEGFEKSVSETKAQHVNTEGKTKWLHWRVDKARQQNEENRRSTCQSGTAEHESKVNFGDSVWGTDQLHPKHVLTCNETCPISPKPLMTTNSIKVEDTEVIFERDFYEKENLRKADYMRLIPLLEVGYRNSEGKSSTDPSTEAVIANETLKNDLKSTQPSEKNKLSQLGSEDNIKMPQKNIHEAKEEFKTVSDDSLDVTNEAYVIEATSEQIQATSEQLQVASEQLKATCEQLKGTSVKLLATSDHLYDSSDKLQAASENLYDTSEKLQDASTRLLDTSEKLENEISNLINRLPNNAYKRREIIEEVDGVDKCGFMITPVANAKEKSENPKTIKIPPTNPDSNRYAKINNPLDNVIKDKLLTEERPGPSDTQRQEKDAQIQGLAQQAAAVSPEPSFEPLPEIKENMKLSEVLSIVRKRNRQSMSVKGPKKDIPPLSRPMHIPPSFRMPTAVPPTQPMHRTCPPPKTGKNKPKLNFSCVDQHLSAIDEVYIDQEELEAAILAEELPTDIAEDFIRQLQSMRSQVESSYKRVENEESPILKRTFFKTEWTKPKFTDRPYTDKRKDYKNNEDLKENTLHKTYPQITHKKNKRPNSMIVFPKASNPIYIKHIVNNMPAQISNSNLEQLLMPAMASVFYATIRHYSDSNEVENVFWRPRSRIPTPEQWNYFVQTSKTTGKLVKEARYLLLTVDDDVRLTGQAGIEEKKPLNTDSKEESKEVKNEDKKIETLKTE